MTDHGFLRFAENSLTPLAAFGPDGDVAFANAALRALFPRVAEGPSGSPVWAEVPASVEAPDARRESNGAWPARAALPESLLDALGQARRAALASGNEQRIDWEAPGEGEAGPRLCCRLVPPSRPEGLVLAELIETSAPVALRRALDDERQARQEAEHHKRRGRELFLRVIEEIPVFVYMQRPDHTVAYANRKSRHLYGEIVGRLCYEVFGGRDSPCPFCPTFRVFDTGLPEEWEFQDCEGRTFRIHDYPFEDENGERLVMELGIDITELKRVERELFQAQKMRAIGVLAGGIAHDLNNNLLPIIFNIEFALGREGDPEVADSLGEALRAANRAAALVDQVREYGRQQNVSRAPLRLTPLVEEHLEPFAASLPPSVTLVTRYRIERDFVSASPAQLEQLLLNLCRNAVQAMPDGGSLSVDVSALHVETLKNVPAPGLAVGEYVVLRVADTGFGIAQDRVERIFEPFYTTKKADGGTGMGLAVVHSIVTSLGGLIRVDSLPGSGTTFTVYLPATQPVETLIVARPRLSRPVVVGRLLLVDDDRAALRAMERVLRGAGFQVTSASGGHDGLAAYLEEPEGFDLVLADQNMPDMGGVEMAERILERDGSVKILICTGFVDPALESRCGQRGVAGFLLKPMTPRALVEHVRRLCR